MTHQVTVHPSGHVFQVPEGETVLAVALNEGYHLPYGCRNGACGSCKGKLLAGRIDQGKYQHSALSPGLLDMVRRNRAAGRLRFTTDVRDRVLHGTVQFIAVGTPPDDDGSADLRYVVGAARSIARHMPDYRVIVNKSTVPVGTADKVRDAVKQELAARGAEIRYSVVSNPGFLKEGAAIEDSMRPDRIVVGTDDEEVASIMRAIYAPFQRNHDRLVVMEFGQKLAEGLPVEIQRNPAVLEAYLGGVA